METFAKQYRSYYKPKHNNKYHKKSKNWVVLTIHGCLGGLFEKKVNFFLVNKGKTYFLCDYYDFLFNRLRLKRIYYTNYY